MTAWWHTTSTFSCLSSSIITGSRRWTRSSYDCGRERKMKCTFFILLHQEMYLLHTIAPTWTTPCSLFSFFPYQLGLVPAGNVWILEQTRSKICCMCPWAKHFTLICSRGAVLPWLTHTFHYTYPVYVTIKKIIFNYLSQSLRSTSTRVAKMY